MKDKEWKKWLFWFTFSIASIIVYKTIDSVGTILSGFCGFLKLLTPFLMAILVAYILYMPCRGIENIIDKSKFKFLKKHRRGLSTLIVYTLAILIIFIAINFVIPKISESVKELVEILPNYYVKTIDYLNNVPEESILNKLNLKAISDNLAEFDFSKKLIEWGSLNNIGSYIKGITGFTSVIFNIFVTIVVSVYIILERTEIYNFLKRLSGAMFNKKVNLAIARYYKKTNSIFFNFIAGQLIDGFVVGIISSIAMSIMGIKYALLLGFMIGLFNIIPYFGAIVAITISIVITIFTGGIFEAIWLGVVIIILQQIDANIINPKIIGNTLNLSPILVIFSVTVGGAYFGVLGMFLGVPVISLVKLILNDFIDYKNKRGFIDKIQSK